MYSGNFRWVKFCWASALKLYLLRNLDMWHSLFNQMLRLLFFTVRFVWLLFEGSYYLRTATIRGWRFFRSKLLIVWLLFKGSVYLKKYGSNLMIQVEIRPARSWPPLAIQVQAANSEIRLLWMKGCVQIRCCYKCGSLVMVSSHPIHEWSLSTLHTVG